MDDHCGKRGSICVLLLNGLDKGVAGVVATVFESRISLPIQEFC